MKNSFAIYNKVLSIIIVLWAVIVPIMLMCIIPLNKKTTLPKQYFRFMETYADSFYSIKTNMIPSKKYLPNHFVLGKNFSYGWGYYYELKRSLNNSYEIVCYTNIDSNSFNNYKYQVIINTKMIKDEYKSFVVAFENYGDDEPELFYYYTTLDSLSLLNYLYNWNKGYLREIKPRLRVKELKLKKIDLDFSKDLDNLKFFDSVKLVF